MTAFWPFVFALGVAQVVSWGTLFYAIGVLGPPMAREIGVSEVFVFGAFTAGLLVSSVASPLAGRTVDARGGRFVLSVGTVLAATAMALLGAATNTAMLVAGWLVAGAAMAACLYDPAFATLAQHAGPRYRRAVALITVLGGLASTAFWPLSHLLLASWGWREAFFFYAGMHLLLCLPVHLFIVPKRQPRAPAAGPVSAAVPAQGLGYLTATFAAAGFVSSVVAVHMVSLLEAQGLTPAQAVSLAMLFGPAQVLARLAELGFAARLGVVFLGSAAFGLTTLAILALLAIDSVGVLAIVFVVTFGVGNGLFTIARGTVPAELYGRVGLGAILGRLARAALLARALAPASFSAMLAAGLTRNAALGVLAALSLASLGGFWLALKAARRGRG